MSGPTEGRAGHGALEGSPPWGFTTRLEVRPPGVGSASCPWQDPIGLRAPLSPEMRRMTPRAAARRQRPAGGRAKASASKGDDRGAGQYSIAASDQEGPGGQQIPGAAGPGQPAMPTDAETLFAYGPESLADAQVLGILLGEPQVTRATGFLEASGGVRRRMVGGPG